jgi:hypothetical protein
VAPLLLLVLKAFRARMMLPPPPIRPGRSRHARASLRNAMRRRQARDSRGKKNNARHKAGRCSQTYRLAQAVPVRSGTTSAPLRKRSR